MWGVNLSRMSGAGQPAVAASDGITMWPAAPGEHLLELGLVVANGLPGSG